MNLRTKENRNRLRKAGFSDTEIEELFVHLEKLVIVPVAWREAATKLTGNYSIVNMNSHNPGSVHAAETEVRV